MGETLGGIIPPTLIDIIVDKVVRNWRTFTVKEKLVKHEGLGLAVGRCLGLFYANDSMVGLRDPEWLQGALNILIGIV